MAITAKFTADFSSFVSAVQQAEVQLQSLDAGAGTVEKSLSRMVNNFSGQKVIRDATLMAEVFDRAGGSAKFTEQELAKMGATGSQAAAKLTAMGLDVPPGIQRIADEAKHAEQAHRSLGEVVKDVAIGFAAMFTARAAFNFLADTVQQASALKDLGQQTHINVEEIQRLAGAMSEFGVDADTLGKGLFTLSRKITGGDDSVVNGLHLMGMTLKDVEGLQGEQLFLKIEHGLATLQGSLRDTAAADIFGGRLGAAMAGASEGIDGALEEAQKLNKVMSTDSVDALDKFGESIERANRSLSAIAANMIGPLAEGFNVLVDGATKGVSAWQILLSFLPKGLGGVGVSAADLATAIDKLNQQIEANAKATQGAAGSHRTAAAALDAHGQAAKFMAALESDAIKPLLGWQEEYLGHLKDIGALTAQNAAGIGVTVTQFEKYKAGLEAAKKAAEDLTKAEAEADAIAMAGYQKRIQGLNAVTQATLKAYSLEGQIAQLEALEAAERALARATFDSLNSAKDRAKVIEDLNVKEIALENEKAAIRVKQAALVNAQQAAELTAQTQLLAAYGQNADGTVKLVSASETLRIKLEELHNLKQKGISQYAQEQVLMDAYTKALYDEAVAEDKARDGAAGHVTELGKIPAAAAAAQAALTALASVMVPTSASLDRAGIIASTITQGGPGPGSKPLPWGGARASGGDVSAGMAYTIGERGPETFVPRTSGTILPNGSSGGGGGITIYVTQPLGTPEAIAKAVDDAISARQRSTGQRMPFPS